MLVDPGPTNTARLRFALVCASLLPLSVGPAWAGGEGAGGAEAIAEASALTAEAILERALASGHLGLERGEATLAMRIQDAAGRVLERTLRSRSDERGDRRRTRITFTDPPDQRGVELLLLEGADGVDTQYLYLPALQTTRRVAGAARHGRFEGSDFTFADLERRDVGEGGRVERLPDAEIGGQPSYHLRVEVPEGGDLAHPRVELWISTTTWAPLRVRYFDRSGELARELQVRRLRRVGERFVPTLMVMSDHRAGSRTTLEVLSLDPDARFPDTVFLPESLGR